MNNGEQADRQARCGGKRLEYAEIVVIHLNDWSQPGNNRRVENLGECPTFCAECVGIRLGGLSNTGLISTAYCFFSSCPFFHLGSPFYSRTYSYSYHHYSGKSKD